MKRRMVEEERKGLARVGGGSVGEGRRQEAGGGDILTHSVPSHGGQARPGFLRHGWSLTLFLVHVAMLALLNMRLVRCKMTVQGHKKLARSDSAQWISVTWYCQSAHGMAGSLSSSGPKCRHARQPLHVPITSTHVVIRVGLRNTDWIRKKMPIPENYSGITQIGTKQATPRRSRFENTIKKLSKKQIATTLMPKTVDTDNICIYRC